MQVSAFEDANRDSRCMKITWNSKVSNCTQTCMQNKIILFLLIDSELSSLC